MAKTGQPAAGRQYGESPINEQQTVAVTGGDGGRQC